jgi:murein L,D-transpeptidase YafK
MCKQLIFFDFPFTIRKLSRNVQLKTKKWWKLWKAGVCQAMTEDVNGA